MSATPTTRAAWVCRCVQRLARQYRAGALLPGGDRPLTWLEHTRLIEQLLAEYREE